MNGWTTDQDLEIIQHRGFRTLFPQKKCYVKTQYVKTHANEADLVGAGAEVCGRWDQHLTGRSSSYSLRHLV